MINSSQYQDLFKSITSELEGDWVVTGGTLLELINTDARVTSDIDLCSIDELTNQKRMALMKLVEMAGFSVESLNPSADYFLKQIPDWEKSIVLLQSGEKGNLFRPTLELYIHLKLQRAT